MKFNSALTLSIFFGAFGSLQAQALQVTHVENFAIYCDTSDMAIPYLKEHAEIILKQKCSRGTISNMTHEVAKSECVADTLKVTVISKAMCISSD